MALALDDDLDVIGKSRRNMLRIPERRAPVRGARYEQRRHARDNRRAVSLRQRPGRPFFAGGLLLPHAIIAEKRALRFGRNVLLTNECDIFAAGYGKE